MARTNLRRRLGKWLLVSAFTTGIPALAGCRVSDGDVQRWGSTEHGPDKLVAVVSHEKYEWPLRVEAGLALLRMKPRNGRRIGVSRLVDAMAMMAPDERKKLVEGMVPAMVQGIKQQAPAPKPGEAAAPDPTIPYKDTAMAMLTYDKAVLVADDAMRKQLTDALVEWSQHDFERRLDNTQQMFGMEQMMRAIGAPAVKPLPSLITPDSTKFDRIAALVAELGDQATKEATASKLVELAKYTTSQAWTDRAKSVLEEANKASKLVVNPDQFKAQLKQYQDEALTKVFAALKKVGTKPAVDYALSVAFDKGQDEKRRQAALAALEGRIDHNNPADVEKILALAGQDDAPDSVRDLAFQRIGEMPRDQVIARLYAQFAAKKWKVRWTAAGVALKMSTSDQIPEFLSKLPPTAAGFAISEPLTYGGTIAQMQTKGKSPREILIPYLKEGNLAAKLTALGFFYQTGKAADIPLVAPLANDKTLTPKVDDPDGKWQCDVPKSDGKETETKDITTVGDFVKFCVEPAMKGR
jgi:hypothetical protein